MLDPRYGNILLDANALEPPDRADKALVPRFLRIRDCLEISVVNPFGVQMEINNARTPATTKAQMDGIYTISTNPTSEEVRLRSKLRCLLQGDATQGKHTADADHIFEASKYGGRYFITHDKKILQRRKDIEEIIGKSLAVVTLREFINVCDKFGVD